MGEFAAIVEKTMIELIEKLELLAKHWGVRGDAQIQSMWEQKRSVAELGAAFRKRLLTLRGLGEGGGVRWKGIKRNLLRCGVGVAS